MDISTPIFVAEPITGDSGASDTGGIGFTRNRATGNTTFKLPTWGGEDIPQAVPLSGLDGIIGARVRAVITIEKNGGAGGIIARYWQDGTWPSDIRGMPLKDGDTITITGVDCINNFRIVSVDAAEHIIQVQLFNF